MNWCDSLDKEGDRVGFEPFLSDVKVKRAEKNKSQAEKRYRDARVERSFGSRYEDDDATKSQRTYAELQPREFYRSRN